MAVILSCFSAIMLFVLFAALQIVTRSNADEIAVTVANLYYNHPILNILAHDFGVRYEQIAQVPTIMQAGYAAGLLFLCPLGDLLPRRPFVCGLVLFTATMW
jgi:predicted MFS family arabinose efflux permease